MYFSWSPSPLSHCESIGKRKDGQKVIIDNAEKLEQLFWKQIPNKSNVCLFKDPALLF
jgi:hypothetical protein